MPAKMKMGNAFKQVMDAEEERKKNAKHHPPDGGWGWVVVFSFAVQNIILLPILMNFGLLFRSVFTQLHLSTTDVTTIININSAAGLLFGLLNGPLLKTFGFRKIACLGALITFFGNVMTSFATSFFDFIFYYGIIASIGISLVMSSFSLALNTYFVEKRGVATGVAMSATGLGPIFMPLLISQLIGLYGSRGTAFIMAAMTLHSFVGAMLLQPVKWHYRKLEDPEGMLDVPKQKSEMGVVRRASNEQLHLQNPYIVSGRLQRRRFSDVTPFCSSSKHSTSSCSLNIHQGNIVRNNKSTETDFKDCTGEGLLNEKYTKYEAASGNDENDDKNAETVKFINNVDNVNSNGDATSPQERGKWSDAIVRLFDLDLLKEPVFLNIWLGMSLEFTAEMNFILMVPLILEDMDYDTKQTANMMAIMAVADICTRFISPFIGRRTSLPARYLYLISFSTLIVFKFCLILADTRSTTLMVFIALGVGRGFRAVYRALVVPNHVPLDKLPNASGLQTVLNGIFLISFGPILGYIKDVMKSYLWYLIVLNCLSLTTVILWLCEILIRVCRQSKTNKTGTHNLMEVNNKNEQSN